MQHAIHWTNARHVIDNCKYEGLFRYFVHSFVRLSRPFVLSFVRQLICMFFCLFVCMFVHVYVRPSVRLPVRRFIRPFVHSRTFREKFLKAAFLLSNKLLAQSPLGPNGKIVQHSAHGR